MGPLTSLNLTRRTPAKVTMALATTAPEVLFIARLGVAAQAMWASRLRGYPHAMPGARTGIPSPFTAAA